MSATHQPASKRARYGDRETVAVQTDGQPQQPLPMTPIKQPIMGYEPRTPEARTIPDSSRYACCYVRNGPVFRCGPLLTAICIQAYTHTHTHTTRSTLSFSFRGISESSTSVNYHRKKARGNNRCLPVRRAVRRVLFPDLLVALEQA